VLRTLQNTIEGWVPQLLNMPTWVANLTDILAISLGIYKIMQWIRETRAWSLFKGMIFVLLLYAAAYMLNMVTVLWVMRATFNIGLIVVVVIFQPELRKALEQLGKGKFLASFLKNDADEIEMSSHTVDEIVSAAAVMSSVRTGALIVIEKNVALGDLEQTGIPVDALVSSQLLINIFEDKTPLHDGAVIIRNNRIAAAACILPLTQTEIGKELGTRHRAAVGASEVSDALCLVVSEESGQISIAIGGKLTRMTDGAEQVRTALRQGIDKNRIKIVRKLLPHGLRAKEETNVGERGDESVDQETE
jgi:diadenylate cyclase